MKEELNKNNNSSLKNTHKNKINNFTFLSNLKKFNNKHSKKNKK